MRTLQLWIHARAWRGRVGGCTRELQAVSGQDLGRGRAKNVHKATWKREFKLPWSEAGPPNHLDDEADSEQVVNKKLSLVCMLHVVRRDPVGSSELSSLSMLRTHLRSCTTCTGVPHL